jgi:hypothetical protein
VSRKRSRTCGNKRRTGGGVSQSELDPPTAVKNEQWAMKKDIVYDITYKKVGCVAKQW